MSKKTCLVTGAAGFIGSHLCEALLKAGHKVDGVDDLSVGRTENLDQCFESDEFAFFPKRLEHITQGPITHDLVFHLGARADIVPSIQNPGIYHQSNVDGTVNILEGIRRGGLKSKLIYAASSSCYGIPDQYPTTESTPCKPKYPYALTKWIGEQYIMHYHRVYGLNAISLRLFNVYGPRARTSGTYGAVFGVFLSQLANLSPLTVVGDGEQRRDFTFVSDVVDAFLCAAETEASGEIFNVGTGNPQSVNTLVGLLADDSYPRVYIPDRPGEPRLTHANIFKIRELLHWSPKVSFEAGVKVMKDMIPQYKTAPLWTADTIKEETKDWFKYLGDK